SRHSPPKSGRGIGPGGLRGLPRWRGAPGVCLLDREKALELEFSLLQIGQQRIATFGSCEGKQREGKGIPRQSYEDPEGVRQRARVCAASHEPSGSLDQRFRKFESYQAAFSSLQAQL